METIILKYNAGNIRSVAFALERLGVQAVVSDNAERILAADRVIFPGVGEAGSAMQCLKEKQLDRLIPALRQPVLGICLGMQLMCSYSAEGSTTALGIFSGEVKRFEGALKCPQIGWNKISGLKDPLFAGLPEHTWVYFVHGYYTGLNADTIAKTYSGLGYSAGLRKNNFYALQFHPEKSGEAGQRILENFMKI